MQFQLPDRIVGGTVVQQNHLKIPKSLTPQTLQAGEGVLPAVVI